MPISNFMEENVRMKYLNINQFNPEWGLSVCSVGCQKVPPHSSYPPVNHPPRNLFSIERGRVLEEYYLLYISKGKGVFVSDNCELQPIQEGDMFMLFPGEWHSYYPDKQTGWNEYWIGFNGRIIDSQTEYGFFDKRKPVLKVGINDEIIELYEQAIKTAIAQKLGFQQLLAGIVNHLLGLVYLLDKNQHLENSQLNDRMNKAKIIIMENLVPGIKIEEIAKQVNMSYSLFRRIFKQYTGLAPSEYIQELKIQKSKDLLAETQLSAKEIAFAVGFENHEYFSITFKKRTGMTPIQFRKFAQRNKLPHKTFI